MTRALKVGLIALLLMMLPAGAAGEGADPAGVAEAVRGRLVEAQLSVSSRPAEARRLLAAARVRYERGLAPALGGAVPGANARARAGFAAAASALDRRDPVAFAAARAQVWTAMLWGAASAVERSLARGDGEVAREWLSLREYRTATRFSRPGADATLAVQGFLRGETPAKEAARAARADLMDTYQARLTEALDELAEAESRAFPARRAELAGLSAGYFSVLAPSYREQRGAARLSEVEALFERLRRAALGGSDTAAIRSDLKRALSGFRAAPLTLEEQSRRAGQLTRFLKLVPVEYGRGVRDGVVTVDLEVREAITFRDGAAVAFADLQPTLHTKDPARTARVETLLQTLGTQLAAAGAHQNPPPPDTVSATTNQALGEIEALIPPEWRKRGAEADLDLVGSVLDQMEVAAAQGDWARAESARLEAYAVLESGPEARLVVFAPQLKTPIEELFWHGQGEHDGLARLIRQRAPVRELKASRDALDERLGEAAKVLGGDTAPFAVVTNAAVIVFREGLEAVLILASLMGSLKRGPQRKLRRPLWYGAALALVFSALTFVLARGLLASLARYGERLEAVVSLVAIGVLLLIMNWFFHKVYWTGWLSNFHSRKSRLVGGREVGQWLGFVLLGFTSIYREGFETVLFLQALVLEGGVGVVLSGVAAGMAGVALIGVLVFALQAKLPHKKMLVVTGVMIGAVLLVMVGNTVHVMQVVGWMPVHPIPWLNLPYWVSLWFGVYATVEGIALQVAAGAFVIGSYFLAEQLQHRRQRSARVRASASGATG